ncbi:polyphosphate kinase 2 family protein [Arsenicicoccus dermatophilus]|uniref:polyphosphate kinase 2 family protein n=1 Tax=Arsenicicoccus dermatophilus TaxID=1076331 RepID=UPI001F4C9723|nr:polyphosphate kinase 2 family protein [Arsenicicoccus dermatophilus]MCH8613061.1 polyphosphate kinase 2 family protein [Arsenicicoccus dermatophilus]
MGKTKTSSKDEPDQGRKAAKGGKAGQDPTRDKDVAGSKADKAAKKGAKGAKKVGRADRTVAPAQEHEGAGAQFGDEDFTFSAELQVGRDTVLTQIDPRSTPGYPGGKKSAVLDLAAGQAELSDLQERLFANGKDGRGPSILLIVQGMDTSGKGGIMRHVVGSTDPGGVKYTAFKAPSAEERQHDFLWRIERALPEPGQIGVFDRSHYEDVLVVRVHDLVPQEEWSKRYSLINAFERKAVARGITIVKVMLHISADEQRERLGERLDRPDKHYKYNPGDIDERARWDDYMQAYQAVLDRTSTKGAPWHVVPADRKWYARLAVQQILLEHLRGLDLQWPEATFDVAVEKQRLAES